MAKINCWEFSQCGRQPGGDHVAEFGECPTVSCFAAHGLNEGINGGRACWAIAGTFCGGVVQGTFIDKHRGCAACDFFHEVVREEKRDLLSVQAIIASINAPV